MLRVQSRGREGKMTMVSWRVGVRYMNTLRSEDKERLLMIMTCIKDRECEGC